MCVHGDHHNTVSALDPGAAISARDHGDNATLGVKSKTCHRATLWVRLWPGYRISPSPIPFPPSFGLGFGAWIWDLVLGLGLDNRYKVIRLEYCPVYYGFVLVVLSSIILLKHSKLSVPSMSEAFDKRHGFV